MPPGPSIGSVHFGRGVVRFGLASGVVHELAQLIDLTLADNPSFADEGAGCREGKRAQLRKRLSYRRLVWKADLFGCLEHNKSKEFLVHSLLTTGCALDLGLAAPAVCMTQSNSPSARQDTVLNARLRNAVSTAPAFSGQQRNSR